MPVRRYNSLFLILYSLFLISLSSCSIEKQISKSANEVVLTNKALTAAHVGISIYEPAANKYWYNYQGDKYFVPASNTKIPTCYAAMKYLGDSIIGLKYGIPEERGWKDNTVVIEATADPTFLHENFKASPVFDFLKQELLVNNRKLGVLLNEHRFKKWGNGWSWNDYDASYMAERSAFPIYGNVVEINLNDSQKRTFID